MGPDPKYPEVPVEKLRWHCAPESLPFQTTEEIQPCTEIIGQERALKAISADESSQTLKDGVEMVFKQFGEVLKNLGIEEIKPVGGQFDPASCCSAVEWRRARDGS